MMIYFPDTFHGKTADNDFALQFCVRMFCNQDMAHHGWLPLK